MASRANVTIGIVFAALGVGLLALLPRDETRHAPASPPPPARAPAPVAALDEDPLPAPADGEISVLSLVEEMADLEHLSRLPAVPFVARQASSYDRRSRRPEDGASWFANDDFATNTAPNLVRVETDPGGGRRYVLLDATGPGAVVRLWTATPAGTLRIYIDDDPRPAVEAPMRALLGGLVEPFTPPFGAITAMGHSLYFPFPFRKRCLVTLDSLESVDPFSGRTIDKIYYQIGYRAYPATAAAQVRPYARAEVNRAASVIGRVAVALAANRPLEARPASPPTRVAIARTLVGPGHPSVTTVEVPSAAAGTPSPRGGLIRGLRLSTRERDPARLGATILSIAFDGEETVRAPLVDFFGSGPGWNPYASLAMTGGEDGSLFCRFPMPFRSRAVVTISRPTDAPVQPPPPPMPPLEISGELIVEPRPVVGDAKVDAEEMLLFHARFRPQEHLATRPIRDWHVATLTGRGHQVGTVLSVRNPPGAFWWGEGDEKIFVDGESFPSVFGTGTEDYFGYAWSSTERFAHPYHAQTLAPREGFDGWFSMNRFLVLDPVPFTTRLRFDLELWHWSDTAVDAAALLYWYARPGGTDDLPP